MRKFILTTLAMLAALVAAFFAGSRRKNNLADTAADLARKDAHRAKADRESEAAIAKLKAEAMAAQADEAARKEIDRDESLADTLGRFGAGR